MSMPKGGFESVELLSPTKKGEGAFSAHVTYDVVAIDASSESTTVNRRYSDFLWIFDRLSDTHPACLIPPLPPKGMLGRFAEEFVNERMRFLQKFLTRCIAHEELGRDENLGLFLRGSDSDLAAAQKEVSKMKESAKGFANFLKRGSKNVKGLVSKGAVRDKSEHDEKASDLMQQAMALETSLGAMVANTDTIVDKEKEKSKNLDNLQKAFAAAGLSENDEDAELSSLYSDVAQVYGTLRNLHDTKTASINVGFREGIKDQQLVAIAVQNMVKTHEGASDSLFEAKTRLTHLQEKKAAMEGDSAKEDKVAALDAQILEAETNVMKGREELEAVGFRCFKDAEVAHKEREAILSNAAVALAEAQIQHARDAIAEWESKILPLARQVAGESS